MTATFAGWSAVLAAAFISFVFRMAAGSRHGISRQDGAMPGGG